MKIGRTQNTTAFNKIMPYLFLFLIRIYVK